MALVEPKIKISSFLVKLSNSVSFWICVLLVVHAIKQMGGLYLWTSWTWCIHDWILLLYLCVWGSANDIYILSLIYDRLHIY